MRGSQNGRPVGRVVGLWRYPVKSMGAEALTETEVSWHGLAGDRRWAFIKNNAVRSGFSWFTLRERSDMARYIPSFVEPDRADSSETVVRTPGGAVFDITDPALGAELSSGGLRVIKQNRGIFDTLPISLITTHTISRLGEMIHGQLDVQRFRPNMLVEPLDGVSFAEDSWVGCTLRIGGVLMRIDQRDRRCVVITIDPVTADRDASILRAVAQERQGCLGVYGSTVQPGCIALNDEVFICPPL